VLGVGFRVEGTGSGVQGSGLRVRIRGLGSTNRPEPFTIKP